jgi:pimeloyl-ACP methyl ester carboxylesterase
MKRIYFVIFSLFTVLILNAQEITGEWNGVLSVQGMKLRLVFHVAKTDAGFTATMDSPDQGAKGIAMTSASFENNVLKLEHSAAKIVFTGTFDGKTEVNGEFVQAGMKFPMTLSRKEVVVEKPNRPQEPQAPFPYSSEAVTFKNLKDSLTLSGTFTYPKGNGKYPVVVLVSGSGPQNRDEELMGHKPFLVLADFLTRNGIAVLRYDDRGCFASTGNFTKALTQDFATDASAAIDYLKSRKEIDTKKIGIIGHSEGAMVAPIVAATRNDLSFIVLMAGPGIQGNEILMLQSELISRANGVPESDISTAKEINSAIYSTILKVQDTDSLIIAIRKIMLEKMPQNADSKAGGEAMIDGQMKQITSPWMLNFIRYNPTPTLEKVKCRVLALNGSLDLQVPADVNLQAIGKALTKGGNKNFTTKKLEGLNHLFQECKTGSPAEYAAIEQTLSPILLNEILDWIKAR